MGFKIIRKMWAYCLTGCQNTGVEGFLDLIWPTFTVLL